MPDLECPICHLQGSLIHVGKSHFGTCKACRVGWWVGYGLFTVPEEIQAKADIMLTYLNNNFNCID